MCKNNDIESLIKKYADIRIEFEKWKEKCPRYLSGNDNYIGIIGEYWAIKFLEKVKEEKNELENFMKERESGNVSKSQYWWDIELQDELISIKAISTERKDKNSGFIYYPKEKKDSKIYSIIVLMLDEYLKPKEILYLKDIDKILNKDLRDKLDKRKINERKYEWGKDKKISFKYYKDGFDKIFKNYIYKKRYII